MPTYTTIEFTHDYFGEWKLKRANGRSVYEREIVYSKGDKCRLHISKAAIFVREGYATYIS